MSTVLAEVKAPTGQWIRAVQGDLTQERVDAIVNAANSGLAHGGGVAGAIVRAGGYEIQEESNRWVREHGPVPTGSAAITGAGRLPARYVIHAVGPVWGTGDEERKLASAVQSALRLADEYRLESISMPGISSGIFGFPKPLAAEVIVRAAKAYLEEHPETTLKEVRFCNIDAQTAQYFAEEVRRQFGSPHGT
ncbi:MAG: macro domain-containing protein [Anaerolineae bacterium]